MGMYSRYSIDAKLKIQQIVPLLAIVIGTERTREGIYKREMSILYPLTVSVPFRPFFSHQVGVVLVSYRIEESHHSRRIAFSELPHSFHLEFLFTSALILRKGSFLSFGIPVPHLRSLC